MFKLQHSSDALNQPLLKPVAIQNEITALRDWVEDFEQRHDETEWLQ